MLQTMLQRIRTAFAMIVAMEPFDATRQMVWQLVGCDSKACGWSARIIEFRLYLRVLWVHTNATTDGMLLVGLHIRIEAAVLRQGVEGDVTAAIQNRRELLFRICRAVGMGQRAELLACKSGFIERTGCGMANVFAKDRKCSP